MREDLAHEDIEIYRNPGRVSPVRQAEEGIAVGEICRKLGIREQTYDRWRKKYGGLMLSEMKCLRQLEEENQRLKKLVADLALDKERLQEVGRKTL